MMRHMNPVFKDDVFLKERAASAETMSVQGTIHKAITGLVVCFLGAILTWNYLSPLTEQSLSMLAPITIGGSLGAFVIYFVAIFKKQWAGFVTPVYAFLQGAAMGGISLMMETQFPGIVFQAILLTFGVTFSLLIAFRAGWIKVTRKFQAIGLALGGAVALTYFASFVLGFFGMSIPLIHGSGPVGIGFSLICIAAASFFLLMDFEFIESASRAGSPKYMEWVGALGLLVTLIFLYLEILKLLSKLQSRR